MEETKVLKLGDRVPDFEMDVYLPDKKDFGKIKFSEVWNQGKWLILFFYPADYTFVCPTELSDLARVYEELKNEGAEVVSVSTDTQFVHMAWQRDEKLLENVSFPMAADPTWKVAKTFGVLDENSGLALRGTFIINPDGELMGSEVNFYPVGRNADELVRKFKAYKYISQHPNEACPAKWQPGEKTLKPGKDLVGRVAENL